MTKLLSINADAKTTKGQKKGFLTGILYLSPATESGVNLCSHATAGCISACLYHAGRARIFTAIKVARLARTEMYLNDRQAFISQITKEIKALVKRADRLGLTPVVRLNGTSDRFDIVAAVAPLFPDVQFYDYTKMPNPWLRAAKLSNYHLTFSWSGENEAACIDALAHGVNVAVPFEVRKGQPLPATFLGHTVIDGDETDLRFLDDVGVIVGLRVKRTGSERESKAGSFFVSLESLKGGK